MRFDPKTAGRIAAGQITGNAAVTDLGEYRARRLEPAQLCTYEELAERLGRSVRQLQRDRALGMPVAYDFGRLLFDPGACAVWLREAV